MGESFGPWRMGNDAEMMRYISSANIACGFHAGDPSVMRRTVELAAENNVSIGAHPGYPDLQGFGRRNMSLSAQEVHDMVLYQISALKGICDANRVRLVHVKPHGALYNQASRDTELAKAIVRAVKTLDPALVIYGLSGSLLIEEALSAGLEAASEVFADRSYRPDGSLTPRTQVNALIDNVDSAVAQVLQMISEGTVTAQDGTRVPIKADTVCIHGDGENAVSFARSIFESITARSIEIRPAKTHYDG